MRALLHAARLTPVVFRPLRAAATELCFYDMGKIKKSWYAVRVGRRPGIYQTWAEAQPQARCLNGVKSAVFSAILWPNGRYSAICINISQLIHKSKHADFRPRPPR
jgi:hypothetical protein